MEWEKNTILNYNFDGRMQLPVDIMSSTPTTSSAAFSQKAGRFESISCGQFLNLKLFLSIPTQ